MPRAYLRALALFVSVLSAQLAAGQDLPTRRVLLLYSHEPEMDSYEPFDRGLRSAIEGDKAFVLEFFTEHLDLLRFSPRQQGDALLRYLEAKYRGHQLDLIV